MKCSLLVLSCYLDGELEAPQRGELEAHLVACQRCRGGLIHLREEVDRISSLAPVRVPDHSARAILEVTGVIGGDVPLPPRINAVVDPPPRSDLPPWMVGEAGAALPWSAIRPRPHQAPPPPSAPPPPPPAAESTADVVELNGSTAQPEEAAEEPSPAAEMPAGPPAVPPDHGFDLAALATLAASQPPPHLADDDVSAESPPAAVVDAAPSDIDIHADTDIETPAPDTTGAESHPGLEGDVTPFETTAPPPSPQDAGEASALPASDPAPSIAADHGRGEEHLLPSEETVASGADAATDSIAAASSLPSPGDPDVALRTPEADIPAETTYPLTDADALGHPAPDESFSPGPVAAPRAGLLSRIRDHFALRRTLARTAAEDSVDGVEIVSGTGAPVRGGRSRAELARRRNEALRPASMPEPDELRPGAGMGEVTGRISVDPPRRQPSLYEQLPPPARPSSTQPRPPVPAPPPEPSREADWETQPRSWRPPEPLERPPVAAPPPGEVRRPWRSREEPDRPAALSPPPPVTTRDRSPSELREGRRLLAVFGAAVVVMFVVGVASARSTSPRPAQQSTTASAPAQPSAAAAKPKPSAAATAPQPSAQATAPSLAPSAAPVGGLQLADVQNLGDGGTGWQVQSLRYGAHTGFLRTVFDLNPTAGAATAPKITVGFTDPTMMIVAFQGASPGGAVSAPAGSVIAAVTLMQPSPIPGATVYQFKLTHPVSIKPGLVPSPMRLVIDLPN